MRSTLRAFESQLQRIGAIAEREEAAAVFVKPDVGDDSNSGTRADAPVKTIERGLELLLQQVNRPHSQSLGRGTTRSAIQTRSSPPVAAEGEMPDSSRSVSRPAHGQIEHVVDAAAMLARAKHAEEDADPPRNSSPVERAHHSEFYEPRALSPPSSAVRPRSRVGSPFSAPVGLQQGNESSDPGTGAVNGLLNERQRIGRQPGLPNNLTNEMGSVVGAEARRGQSPLGALKQQAQVEMTWESDDDEDARAVLRPHSAAHRETNAGKVITTYAEHSARQEVPSLREQESDSSMQQEEEEEEAEEEEEEEEEEDAAAAFEKRLAAGKERRTSPSGETDNHALLCF